MFQETLQSTQSKLGILGTKSTVTSGFFEKAFLELDPALDITSIACPMFATLVEEGLENHPATYLLAKEYLAPLFQK
ncbi:glutamate racemase, partial [bacterium]|nr:glutamate racemase [bacterium]